MKSNTKDEIKKDLMKIEEDIKKLQDEFDESLQVKITVMMETIERWLENDNIDNFLDFANMTHTCEKRTRSKENWCGLNHLILKIRYDLMMYAVKGKILSIKEFFSLKIGNIKSMFGKIKFWDN